MKRYLLLLPLLASCATMRAAGPGLIDCAAPMMSTLTADVLGQVGGAVRGDGFAGQAIRSSTDHYSLTAHATAPYTVAIGVEVQEDCDVVLDQVAVKFGDITPQ